MVKAWCGAMVTFVIIALICIGLIMQPVRVIGSNTMQAQSAITEEGMILRAEAWKKYPEYNIGLGIVTAIAFTGAIYASAQAYKEKQRSVIEN